MNSIKVELSLECKRESENCLYTSTALFIWLRFLRTIKVLFQVVPLILGSLASWKLLTILDLSTMKLMIAIFSFIAGLSPTIYSILKFDDNLGEAKHLAGEFKNLQDRFRQAALICSKKSFPEFELEFKLLMNRLEQARSLSITAPEWCFKAAQRKIKIGDYDFNIDMKELIDDK